MLGLAVLSPVVPFALEFLALRRLTTSAFGTLMSLEPAIALLVGLVVLGQRPGAAATLGLALVVLASVGATRAGHAHAAERGRGRRMTGRPDVAARASCPRRINRVDARAPVLGTGPPDHRAPVPRPFPRPAPRPSRSGRRG
ncbi:EamA family transporter [Streptomyces sp. M19]